MSVQATFGRAWTPSLYHGDINSNENAILKMKIVAVSRLVCQRMQSLMILIKGMEVMIIG